MKHQIAQEDLPAPEAIGTPKYKYVNGACARANVTVARQRVVRMAVKNMRRRINGLPPLSSYAQV